MVWFAQFTNNSNELRIGVEGYFATNGIVDGGPPNGARSLLGPGNVVATPTTVIFTNPDFMGRMTFFGTGLQVGSAALPNGQTMPVLTAGTVTGFELLFNYRLFDAVNTGIGDPFPLRSAQFLEPSASFSLPNVPAAAFGVAVQQAYQTNSSAPIVNFLSSDVQSWTGSERTNILVGFAGSDFIDGRGGNDAIDGGAGNDTLVGGPGVDILAGGAGSDLFLPGPAGPGPVGDSVSDNGTAPGEVDVVSYRNVDGPVLIDLDFSDGNQSAGAAERVQIEASIEVIEGSQFSDRIIGRNTVVQADDTLVGLAGNDLLEGRAGRDALLGGPGDDVLDGGTNFDLLGNVDPVGDRAVYSVRSDQVDLFRTQNSFLVVTPIGGIDELFNIETLQLTDGLFSLFSFPLSNAALFRGTAQADRFDGTNGRDLMFGSGNSDTLIGNAGNDQIEGGDGADTLDGGTGADALVGGAGGDVYFVDNTGDTVTEFAEGGGVDRVVSDVSFVIGAAHIEELILRSEAGSRGQGNDLNNLIRGASGADTLEGGNGLDTLEGGSGNDVLIGGTAEGDLRDVIFAGEGNDSAQGGYGNDELRGDSGNDTLEGGFGADTVIGGAGNDLLTAGAWGDVLFGGDGMDFINGGFGFDRLNGGAGGDRFFHQGVVGHGDDWIQDYTASDGDVLMYGGEAATRTDFLVQRATTAGAGDAGVQELFVTYVPTGDLLWALVDGAGQSQINVLVGGVTFDLLM